MKQLLLCTDLDRTLIPNGPHPETKHARILFKELVKRDDVKLVYVTGRDSGLVRKAVKNFNLPLPDYVIADVGSTIYKVDGAQWTPLDTWENIISRDWKNHSYRELHRHLAGVEHLVLQEYHKQNRHKLSYYVPLYVNKEVVMMQIQEVFNAIDVQANLIWSIDEPAQIGLLDILPASASKLKAIEYLMEELECDIGQTLFAGDSGNDLSVMVSPIRSIVVANASDDVKQRAREEMSNNVEQNSLYFACGDYLGMNGNYSAGILEGVAHYIPEMDQWLRQEYG